MYFFVNLKYFFYFGGHIGFQNVQNININTRDELKVNSGLKFSASKMFESRYLQYIVNFRLFLYCGGHLGFWAYKLLRKNVTLFFLEANNTFFLNQVSFCF